MALQVWYNDTCRYWCVGTPTEIGACVAIGRFESESDARKFAAADEMLEALRLVASDTKAADRRISVVTDKMVANAIAAAEPKPPTPPTTAELVGVIRSLRAVIDSRLQLDDLVDFATSNTLARADAVLRAAKGGVA